MTDGDVTMNYEIRRCKLEDAASICELNREDLGYDFPLQETTDNLEKLLKSENDRIYVAIHDGKVAGYVHACTYQLAYAPHMKNLMALAVVEAYRKKGIGQALLKQIENWAKKDGASGIRLVSGTPRLGAHTFYQRCGYKLEKEQYNFKKTFDK